MKPPLKQGQLDFVMEPMITINWIYGDAALIIQSSVDTAEQAASRQPIFNAVNSLTPSFLSGDNNAYRRR
jgi:hypothetical protein